MNRGLMQGPGSGVGGSPRRRAKLHQVAHRAPLGEIEEHLVATRTHDEDAATAHVEQVLGPRHITYQLALVEATALVADVHLEAIREQPELALEELRSEEH